MLSKDCINEILDNRPPNKPFTLSTAKEQVFICLNCFNSWEDKGFFLEETEYKILAYCNNCQEIIWETQKCQKQEKDN